MGRKKKKSKAYGDSNQTFGRPSKFDPKFADMLIKFFDQPPYEEKTKTIFTRRGDEVEVNYDAPTDFPTLASFAISIGVHRDSLHEWANAKNEKGQLINRDFSDAYKRAKDFQERYLTTNGLKGIISQPFAIFTAKNVLGWKDKTEVTNPDGSMSPQVHIILPDNGRDKKK